MTPPFYSLNDAVQMLTVNEKPCLFTMGNTAPCYTCAIIKNEGQYYFVDSHSRGETGMLSPDGTACMTVHKNSNDLCLFIRHLASSLKLIKPIPFEIANVEHQNLSEYGSSDSDFSGFDPISDGEYTCKLYLAQEKVEFALKCNDLSEICSLSDSSDNSNMELHSSELDECIQSIDDSAVFMDTIDSGLLDTESVRNDHLYEVDSEGRSVCNEFDEFQQSIFLNGENIGCETNSAEYDSAENIYDDEYGIDDDEDDEDYKADESADSSESEDVPLARYLRSKKPASKLSHKQASSVGSSSSTADPTLIVDGFGDSSKQSMSESRDIQPNNMGVSGDGLFENNVSGSSDPSQSGCGLSQTADTRGRKRKREPHKWKKKYKKTKM